jgi:hypothetical protein
MNDHEDHHGEADRPATHDRPGHDHHNSHQASSPEPVQRVYPRHPTLAAAHPDEAAQSGHAEHAASGAHDRHAGHSVAMFRDKFWISLALTVPTLAVVAVVTKPPALARLDLNSPVCHTSAAEVARIELDCGHNQPCSHFHYGHGSRHRAQCPVGLSAVIITAFTP